MKFVVTTTAEGSQARAGTVTTQHSEIATPVFMPVGTRGTVRTQNLDQLAALGPKIMLANTYHLLLTPGIEVFEQLGGLHKWMGWNQSILTDSGGFQIFSLATTRRMSEHGAEFVSRIDGKKIMLTPERSIAMQRAIGSDIMMVLDQCIDSTSDRAAAVAAMELTHRWAMRSLVARDDSANALFAIAQGACFPDLRKASVEALCSLPTHNGRSFDGFAIGGLAVGESKAQREDMTEVTAQMLPRDKPRYLMGVGTPIDLLEAVHRGVDMFDCVIPTSWAQQGEVFTSRGRVSLRRTAHKFSQAQLDAQCDCQACVRYTRSYLHHLVKCKEPLGWQLLAFHNLRFYLRLMEQVRAAIHSGTFLPFYRSMRETLVAIDDEHPRGPRPVQKVAPQRGNFRVKLPLDPTVRSASIEHIGFAEVMHSVNDPNLEAKRIYIDQSEILRGNKPVVVWDVGLGAGHNAMALVRFVETCSQRRQVKLISFEHDLDALRLAADELRYFPHLAHQAPHRLLRALGDGEATIALEASAGKCAPSPDGNLQWQLLVGDFHQRLQQALQPDVIFYDPFSHKSEPGMWGASAFAKLFATVARPDHVTELFTYSNSTAIRCALLAAGFFVGAGVGTGPKSETTVAWSARPDGKWLETTPLLGPAWLSRLAKSTAAIAPELAERARLHPQFSQQ